MTDILDITEPFFLPWDKIALSAGGLLFAALLFFIIWKFLKKRGGFRKPSLKESPPDEEAMKALSLLAENKWVESGDFRKYYFKLSEIFRRYLGRRFDLAALDWTCDEIVASLSRLTGVDPPLQKETIRFLGRADLSKFAGFKPGPAMALLDHERVKSFVLATKHEKGDQP